MSLFLTVFFLLYGGMHFYVFIKTRAAFSPKIITNISVVTFMVFMILAPVIVRLTEKAGHEDFARVVAFFGYTWMGAMLIFIVTAMLCDVFRLIIYSSGVLSSKDFSYIIHARMFYFFICLITTLLVVIYGIFEARQIKVEHIIIPTKKISSAIGKVRLAQISDVHLGLIIGEERIKRIVSVVKKAKPDILVSTGDLVDVQIDNIDDMADLFNEISVPFGKYAVTGNHEFYAGIIRSIEFTKRAGFEVLSEEAKIIPGVITIAGVDDEAVRGWRKGEKTAEHNLCSHIDGSHYTILLKHRPVPYTGSLCIYDLQLSGHTHKGQIFPFYLFTKFFFSYYAGFYELNNNSSLYVSRGTGTWGPPIRFLAPPEVTIIDIIHKSD